MRVFRIYIVTKIERNESISLAHKAISRSGGWVNGHQFFSNMAATINFELPSNGTGSFISELEMSGFQPSLDGDVPKNGEGDLQCQISFTFVHQEPDIKREVPAFG